MRKRADFRSWTPAQIAALAFGVFWVGNAAAIFATAEPSGAGLGTDGVVHVVGLSIAVNGWHGLFHLTTGLAGVAVCWWPRASRTYALVVGIVYLAAALNAAVMGATVFGLIHVDELGSADHAIEGAALLTAWLVSGSETPRARRLRPQSQ